MLDLNKEQILDLNNINVITTTQQIIDLQKKDEEIELIKPSQIYKFKYLKAKKIYYNIK
jgi:hypothetical protein